MARKFDLISELYERTCFAVTDNPVNWQSFLKTAGRNFRLRFDEQLLIYAQRPDATAVLEIERWNGTFGRWVNRGAKGIAVFEDADRSRQRLIHYFDISDTHESRYSRPVPIWEMRPDYEAEVIETLENTFGAVNDTTSIENVVKESIANAVEDNIADYISDFMSLGAGSDIEYLSADEANALYLELVRHSVSYMVMARLGLDADKVYSPDDFAGISSFNSQEVLNAVGIATSDIAEMALLPVSRTISTLSKENRIIDERGNPNTIKTSKTKGVKAMSEITYTMVGDYNLPNLKLPEQTEVTLGRWSQMRRTYLKEHHKILYYNLLTKGILNSHLAEVQQRASELEETLVKQMAQKAGLTEQMKAEDMMKWVRLMNNIRNSAQEIVKNQVIFA